MSLSSRLLPVLTPENTAFWTGGARGELLITHCRDCECAIHPPQLICPTCLSRNVYPRPAQGTGTVYSFTINHQPWLPQLPVPYALGVIDLDGEPGVRVTAQIVGADALDIAIGERVVVQFEAVADIWVPQFRRVAPKPPSG